MIKKYTAGWKVFKLFSHVTNHFPNFPTIMYTSDVCALSSHFFLLMAKFTIRIFHRHTNPIVFTFLWASSHADADRFEFNEMPWRSIFPCFVVYTGWKPRVSRCSFVSIARLSLIIVRATQVFVSSLDERWKRWMEGGKEANNARQILGVCFRIVATPLLCFENIGLVTKWLRILSMPPNDKSHNHIVANPILNEHVFPVRLILPVRFPCRLKIQSVRVKRFQSAKRKKKRKKKQRILNTKGKREVILRVQVE